MGGNPTTLSKASASASGGAWRRRVDQQGVIVAVRMQNVTVQLEDTEPRVVDAFVVAGPLVELAHRPEPIESRARGAQVGDQPPHSRVVRVSPPVSS